MKGMTRSEVLWNSFQGNATAMQEAIDDKDRQFMNGMYYWHRDIHEHITGGKDKFHFGKKEGHAMGLEDRDKMIQLLDYAPWVQWSVTANTVPEAQLGNVAKPDSHAMNQLQQCMEACKAVCMNVQSMFKELNKEGVLSSPEAGSIPSLMKAAMQLAKDMESEHIQPMAAMLYDVTDGTKKATVKDVKETLHSAAMAVAPLRQHLNEAKVLVQKYKVALKKKGEEAKTSKKSS